MINKILFTAATFVCCHLVSAQTRDSLPAAPGAKANTGPKPYGSVITKNAKTSIGLFTVHKVDDKFYFELPDSILGRDVLVVSRLTKAAADMRSRGSMAGYAGDELNENVLRFEKGPNNKLFVRNLSYNERSADSSQALYKAVMNSNIQPISLVFDIKSIRKDSVSGLSSTVIEMTDIINGDNDIFFFGPSKQAFKIGGYQADKSYVIDVKAYPINVEIKTLKTYTKAALGMTSMNGMQSPVGPSGNFTVEINTSIVLLPKVPMQVRFADDRVGYFTKDYTDFDANPQRVKEQSFIERWKLEPKEEDIEKYKSGELVEPQKQIVIYIDPATPAKWVPYLLQGINDWNGAFEKAGFKNAIIGKKAPTPQEDPTWSLEDARHSALVYKPSAVPNASGPQISDPRSGEVIETHINWYHNVMKLIHNWYFIQTAAVDPKARHMQFDDELMGQLIRFVSSHEVGHTLGLMHNYGASSTVPVEKLRDKKYVEANGHTPSIMDYARFNYVAQPEDNITEKGIFPRIGAYDKWAIQWGYRWLPQFDSPDAEMAYLNKLVIDSLSRNKQLFFGYEIDASDPRSQSEDLGDDAVLASTYGIRNLKRILPKLAEWTRTPYEGYEPLRAMNEQLFRQYNLYMAHVLKSVGGMYTTPKSVEQSGPVFEPVPYEKQKAAMQFLDSYLFHIPDWLSADTSFPLTGSSADPYFGAAQYNALSRLMGSGMLIGFIKNEIRYKHKKVYACAEFLADLKRSVWGELYSHQPIDLNRRNLQRMYIDAAFTAFRSVNEIVGRNSGNGVQFYINPDPTKADVAGLIRAHLLALRKDITNAIPSQRGLAKDHLENIIARIDKALKAGDEIPK